MKQRIHTISVVAFFSLALLGAGCARNERATQDTQINQKKSEESQNLLDSAQVDETDQEFTTGSAYMRETPQRLADLQGKKPFFLYFYADCNNYMRIEHASLVQMYDQKKINVILLRVNYTDNQVTDEGVALAKNLSITQAGTIIGFDASGKEIVRYVGPVDEDVLRGLQTKVLSK